MLFVSLFHMEILFVLLNGRAYLEHRVADFLQVKRIGRIYSKINNPYNFISCHPVYDFSILGLFVQMKKTFSECMNQDQ